MNLSGHLQLSFFDRQRLSLPLHYRHNSIDVRKYCIRIRIAHTIFKAIAAVETCGGGRLKISISGKIGGALVNGNRDDWGWPWTGDSGSGQSELSLSEVRMCIFLRWTCDILTANSASKK